MWIIGTFFVHDAYPNQNIGNGLGPRLRNVDMLLESHANAMALCKGKPIAHYTTIFVKEVPAEEVYLMIWEGIKRKFQLWDMDRDESDDDDGEDEFSSED